MSGVSLVLSILLLTSCAAEAPDASMSASESETQSETQVPAPTSESPSASESPVAGAGAYIPLASFQTSGDKYDDFDVVLFFNASWCSTCKVIRDDLEASRGDIPADLVIVIVDFDKSVELKKKHRVTIQHTFVQVDADGNELARWAGSASLEKILEQII